MTTAPAPTPQHELVELLTTVIVEECRAVLGRHPGEQNIGRRAAHRVALIVGPHADAVLVSHYAEPTERPFEPSSFVEIDKNPDAPRRPSASVVASRLRDLADEIQQIPTALRQQAGLLHDMRVEAFHFEHLVELFAEVGP